MLTAQQAIKVMRILIVDPDDSSSETIVSRLKSDKFEKVFLARTGEEALRLLSLGLASREPIDLVLLSLNLPDRPGLETFDEVHNVFDLALVLLTNLEDRHLALDALGRGANDYLIRPVNPELFLLKAEKLLTRRFLNKELRRSTARNETLFLNVLAVMAKVLEAKDPYTRYHSEQVSMLSSQVAREMGFQDDEVRRVGVAGILHDLGKMGIREAILKKQGPLDKAEREMVERHPIIASTILEPIEQLQSAVGYIKYHHEHFDGTGYPERLVGEQIPLGARIIHATEAFDAMVSRRGYNKQRTPEEALAELRRCSGKEFDPQVVEALAVVLRKGGHLGGSSNTGGGDGTPGGGSDQIKLRSDGPSKSLPELLEDLIGQVSL